MNIFYSTKILSSFLVETSNIYNSLIGTLNDNLTMFKDMPTVFIIITVDHIIFEDVDT